MLREAASVGEPGASLALQRVHSQRMHSRMKEEWYTMC
jgi:hypothetical protein